MRAVLLWTLFSTVQAWGAPLPYTPSGDGVREGCDPLALSRGLFWRRLWFPTMRAVLLWTLFPTALAWGAPLPYTPSGDGVREGCGPLALSRGCSGGN